MQGGPQESGSDGGVLRECPPSDLKILYEVVLQVAVEKGTEVAEGAACI